MQYSDTKRTEQLKRVLVEQNDKVITHLAKMLDADEDECFQVIVTTVLNEASRAISGLSNCAGIVVAPKFQNKNDSYLGY